jgi:2-polyprenyl-3-methyl-5-hydroxy-6-metoxy-1,4-benzoquinol methylase
MAEVDLRVRSTQSELMDTEPVAFPDFHECLQELEVINICTLAYRPTLRWLKEMLKGTKPGRSVSVLDVGGGGGDMLRRIWKLLRRRGLNADLAGVDLNPWSKQSAEQSTPPEMHIAYETSDIFSFDRSRRADFIICSNFTHHLSDAELVRFIHWMEDHANRGWFINDLHRHPLPYYFIKMLFGILPLNRMTANDGPISVSRAFTAADWRRILTEAGVGDRAKIGWFFPFRYTVACRK